jgi:hypothetical protein
MSRRGIIYLIQPGLLVGSKIYKLGYSNSPTLSRCINGYIKGSRYISIHECYDPLVVEKILIKKFKNLFTLAGGNENFEGDENIMCMTILQTIIEYKQNNAPSNNSLTNITNNTSTNITPTNTTNNTPSNNIPNSTTNNTSTNTSTSIPTNIIATNDTKPTNTPTNTPTNIPNDTTNESLTNNKHSVINYYCKICKSYYSSYQSLWIHNKKYHINNCEKCNKKFDNLQNKLIHQKNCSGNSSNQNLKSELNILKCKISKLENNTSNKTNNLLCKYCNKIFSRIDNLNRHYISCKIKKHQEINITNNTELEEMIKTVIIKMNSKTTDNINNNNS